MLITKFIQHETEQQRDWRIGISKSKCTISCNYAHKLIIQW